MRDALGPFAAAAQAFLACCDEEHADQRERLISTSRALARLYALAWSLDEAHEDAPEDVEVERLDGQRVRDRIAAAFPTLGMYRTVECDCSVETDHPTMYGDAIDDLGDIYIDLHAGLEHLRCGRPELARESWSFSFRTHWGAHLVDVLRVLHRRLATI